MPDPAAIVDSLGHIATRRQLLARGCSGFDLTIAVRRGEIHRVRQARYATARADFDAIAATRVGGMLAGPSAARSYGLWSGFDRRVHVSVGDNSSRLRTNLAPRLKPPVLTPDFAEREVVVHWLAGGAVPELGPECWRVPWATALRQVVAWCDRETAIACLDTALTKLPLTTEALRALFHDSPPGDRLVAAACVAGSDSGTESIVRQRLLAVGIRVEQQLPFAFGRVDLQVEGSRLIIEVDSVEFHGTPEAQERDRMRDAELTSLGYTVIRLAYDEVFGDWQEFLGRIRAALASP